MDNRQHLDTNMYITDNMGYGEVTILLRHLLYRVEELEDRLNNLLTSINFLPSQHGMVSWYNFIIAQFWILRDF